MSLMYPEPAPSLFGDDAEPSTLGAAVAALRAAGRSLLQPLQAMHQGRVAKLELTASDDRQLGDIAANLDEIEAALTGRVSDSEPDPAQLTLDLPEPRAA
jgi:hypothetical protein